MLRFCLTFDQTEVGEVIYNTVHGSNFYECLVSSLRLHTLVRGQLIKITSFAKGWAQGWGWGGQGVRESWCVCKCARARVRASVFAFVLLCVQ